MDNALEFDHKKAFAAKWSELCGGRWNPLFHLPALRKLDQKISAIADGTLKQMILSMSAGVSVEKERMEEENSDSENKIPYLRLQNITDEGLNLDDCIFINREAQEKHFKRSRVFEGDLLVAMSGNIACCVVAPKGFEGNIGQNIVVIKTVDRKRSELIAAFLNSNIGHALALKRATGESKPVLDLDALKNMPILLDERIFKIMDTVYQRITEKNQQAELELNHKLHNMDAELFSEQVTHMGEKAFYIKWSEVQKRFDISYYLQAGRIYDNYRFNSVALETVLENIQVGFAIGKKDQCEHDEGEPYLCAANLLKSGKLKLDKVIHIRKIEERKNYVAHCGDILFNHANNRETVGKSVCFNEKKPFYFGNQITCLRVNKEKINPLYLWIVLNRLWKKGLYSNISVNSNNQFSIRADILKKTRIPYPSRGIQDNLAGMVNPAFQSMTNSDVRSSDMIIEAKRRVDEMILEIKL